MLIQAWQKDKKFKSFSHIVNLKRRENTSFFDDPFIYTAAKMVPTIPSDEKKERLHKNTVSRKKRDERLRERERERPHGRSFSQAIVQLQSSIFGVVINLKVL